MRVLGWLYREIFLFGWLDRVFAPGPIQRPQRPEGWGYGGTDVDARFVARLRELTESGELRWTRSGGEYSDYFASGLDGMSLRLDIELFGSRGLLVSTPGGCRTIDSRGLESLCWAQYRAECREREDGVSAAMRRVIQ